MRQVVEKLGGKLISGAGLFSRSRSRSHVLAGRRESQIGDRRSRPHEEWGRLCHHHKIMGGMRPDIARTKGIKTRLEKLARISLAGTAAQRHFNAKSYRRYHGASDMQNAVDLISHLTRPNCSAYQINFAG
jgi:hypothetical protein